MREIVQAGKHHTMTQHKSPKLSQVARGAWNLPWIQQPIPGARHFCYGLKMLRVAVARLSSILRFTPCSQRSPLEAHTSALSSCGRSTCWWKACKGRRARKLRIFFCPSSRVLVFAVNLFYWLDQMCCSFPFLCVVRPCKSCTQRAQLDCAQQLGSEPSMHCPDLISAWHCLTISRQPRLLHWLP